LRNGSSLRITSYAGKIQFRAAQGAQENCAGRETEESWIKETEMFSTPFTLSVAGKGGTGKTSTTALLLRAVLEKGLFEEILVVDADPASNIGDILGVSVTKTIGDVLDRRKISLETVSAAESKLLREELVDAIGQADGFDFLVMGRTTGKGCYCPVNSLLRKLLDEVIRLYGLVLIDFDAGLEHFSRQTDTKSDALMVITDPSKMGFETARRIKDLAREIGYSYRLEWLVGSRFSPRMEQQFFACAEATGLEPLHTIPYDEKLMTLNLEGKTIFDLDANSASYISVGILLDKIHNLVSGKVA